MSESLANNILNCANQADAQAMIKLYAKAKNGKGNINKGGATLAFVFIILAGAGIAFMYCMNGHQGFWDLSKPELLRNVYIISSVGLGSAFISAISTIAFNRFGEHYHANFGFEQDVTELAQIAEEFRQKKDYLGDDLNYLDKEKRPQTRLEIQECEKQGILPSKQATKLLTYIDLLEKEDELRKEINKLRENINKIKSETLQVPVSSDYLTGEPRSQTPEQYLDQQQILRESLETKIALNKQKLNQNSIQILKLWGVQTDAPIAEKWD
jgi:hypothetical protein